MSAWCDRRLTVCSYCFALFVDERGFHRELRRLGVPIVEWPKFLHGSGGATTHMVPRGVAKNATRPLALVCIDGEKAKELDGVVVAGLLAHEAVHIWQAHARDIGAGNDHGDEEEAYAIQNIAQALMWKFCKLVIR